MHERHVERDCQYEFAGSVSGEGGEPEDAVGERGVGRWGHGRFRCFVGVLVRWKEGEGGFVYSV